MSQQQTDYPTGFSASDLPFYKGLDDQKFEEFCTDLLNLHPEIDCLRHGSATTRRIVKADRLLSGTDQRGSDIHATADKGEQWRLQCKHVQGLNSKQVSKAMDLAESGFPLADQFVLVTSCGLKDAVQQTIRDRPKWLWWGPSHLTNLTVTLSSRKDAENLVDRHFSPDDRRRLFPGSNQPLLNWREFFAETISPEGRRFHHSTEFIPQPDVLSRLEAFAEKGAGWALILSAAGGQGKSRLLLELAKSLEGKPKTPRVFFLNLSSKGLDRDLADFLSREPKDLLLVVDDAHRLSAAMEDVARAAAKMNSVRLLVATRPEAVAALESQLHGSGYVERLEKRIDLFPWKQEDVYKLAEEILKPEHRHQAARLAGLADKCPLLVVLGGAMLNSGEWPETMIDHEAFREKVFKSFKNDFLERQLEHQRERLDQLIKLLAFVSPTAKNDTFYNKAAEILGCPPIAVGEDVKALQAARLVVENREGIRLYPDLFADAVLLDACLDQKGRPTFLHRTILSKLPITDFPALMRNVAQADWETRSKTGEAGALFAPVWKEFLRRFEEGVWEGTKDWRTELELYLKEGPKDHGPDRAKLLSQWASFAVYLPEKTLELAGLVIKSASDSPARPSPTSESQADIRSSVRGSLPPLLKPIVTWHPQYADQALDILWSLDADEPKGDWQNDSNAIAVIAGAASFAFQKPPATSMTVIDWLERKLLDSVAIRRLRHQPWILSAMLKPFFEREVEHTWSTGNAIHVQPMLLSVAQTRPLRQRALAIVDKFVNSPDVLLSNAVVPLIEEAIAPLRGRFGSSPSEDDHRAWRPDRLEVVKIVASAVQAHQDTSTLLLQLRRILRSRCECEYEPDPMVRKECQRVLSEMPNTFELRVARVLASFAHDEVSPKSGPTFDADFKAAETQWAEFRRSVAREIVGQFRTANEVCEFLSRMVRDLAATNSVVLGGALLEPIAQISPGWCAALLEEVLRTADPTLDGFLSPLLGEAARQVPEAYHKALDWLPAGGRPQHLCALVSFLGWKQLHGGGLTQLERQCVLASAKRPEEAVVAGVAWAAGCSFAKDPGWAIEVLSRLKPSNERAGNEIVQALGFLVEKHAPLLDPKKVAECLANVGEFCFSERLSNERDLHKVARAFPKQVYEHERDSYRGTEAKRVEERRWGARETISLGPIGDDEYVDHEIQQLWKEAVSVGAASLGQHFGLSLIRSLLCAGAAAAPSRLRRLIVACANGDELKLAAKVAAAQGSRFVFEFPDIVRLLLTRGQDSAVGDAVREMLLLSVCRGGRIYSEHELDPEYRYILEQGEALANRYRDDAVLHKFYRMLAESKRHQAESQKRAFQTEDDMD